MLFLPEHYRRCLNVSVPNNILHDNKNSLERTEKNEQEFYVSNFWKEAGDDINKIKFRKHYVHLCKNSAGKFVFPSVIV